MEQIRIEVADGVRRVTLNRPAQLNAITTQMHAELEAAFDAFAAAEDEHICLITGSGRGFCAGTDLKEAASSGARAYPAHGYAGLTERFDCPKPFVAVVNGLAVGGGFELALACDIILAGESASFGLPEPLVGAVALGGGLHRLARQIPLKQAMGLILSARRVPAAEGYRMGFVTEVAADADLDACAVRWCADLLRGSPMSLRASKTIVHAGLNEPGTEAALLAQPTMPAFQAWRNSADAREGPAAFAEKRPPKWTGR